MAVKNILNRGGNQEILLAQAQRFTLYMVIFGVQHLRNSLCHSALFKRPYVVALIKGGHIEILTLCAPKP